MRFATILATLEQARIGAGWNARFFALPLIVSGCGVVFGIIAAALIIVSSYALNRILCLHVQLVTC